MSDPAIRAALEAAGQELAVRQHDGMTYREAAALTVAAFLRALRPCDVMMPQRPDDPDDPGGPHSTVTLAAAVEQAAQEDRT